MIVKGFWEHLPKPFFCLAPLHDVTDAAFRLMIARRGKPDVMFTEFVSTDGLVNQKSRDKMIRRYLGYSEAERPIVVQIWGARPDHYFQSALLARELGFDGIDINMGCPDKDAVRTGACAALINRPALAQEIIRAAMAGAGDLPVSVKTRIGYDTIVIEEWMHCLLEMRPTAITLHGRTKKEMSRVPAHWDIIGRAAEIARGSGTLLVGNGDVKSLCEAREEAARWGVDGVMIGRGIFENHWLFARDRQGAPGVAERMQALVEHAETYEKLFSGHRSFHVLRKHFSAYASGFAGAKELRMRLMRATTAQDVAEIVHGFL